MTEPDDPQLPPEEAEELAGPLLVASEPEDDDPLQHVGDEADAPQDTGADPDPLHDFLAPLELTGDLADAGLPEARPWRLARALIQMRAEQNALWPNRDRASDGTIGDASHASRESDHNPWVVYRGVGVVRAADTDVDRFPAAAFAELVRKLGAGRDRRLNPDGYVIYNRRIASAQHGWAWHAYTGTNPHVHHVHVSVTTAEAGYDSGASWGLHALLAPVHRHATPTLTRRGANPPAAVKDLQGHMNAWRARRNLSTHARDGVWDEWLDVAFRTFQRAYGLRVDGICGDESWRVVHYITKGAIA